MPRSKAYQKDLSKGWKSLHRRWKYTLDRKLQYSNRLLARVLKKHDRPIICWSGGKDSTVVLHLALQHIPDIPVIYVNSGVEFKESLEFIDHLVQAWNLDITVSKPQKGQTIWDVGANYGWPILGKGVASNVERAVRTGNIRPQLSPQEVTLARHKVRISARCSEFIQERPSKLAEESLGADLKIVGLRASESRARVRLWVDHGDYYSVKRYYGRGRGIWKVNPIATWTDDDIWRYHQLNGIPHSKLYDMGYPRNGCWLCAMGIRMGQLKRLRLYHPRLFKRLITKTAMGYELLKVKKVLTGAKNSEVMYLNDPATVLKNYPHFFDIL
ncbi:phosphoadenosine phosphosulfate reductase family protein [Candidatus Eisenbacteria bacterium]|uniref:Phosphoadenosine phosphosulfate reductase family protein n=1 Tax=Eiseniibacteriota bacterium TaxID=2212470 RepID=A0ABV6YMJ0_UNCEI